MPDFGKIWYKISIKDNIMGFHRKYNALFKSVDNMIKLYKMYKEKKEEEKKDGKKWKYFIWVISTVPIPISD